MTSEWTRSIEMKSFIVMAIYASSGPIQLAGGDIYLPVINAEAFACVHKRNIFPSLSCSFVRYEIEICRFSYLQSNVERRRRDLNLGGNLALSERPLEAFLVCHV